MSLLAELMSVDVLNLIGLLAVVFIGLPHGAMDGEIGHPSRLDESSSQGCNLLVGFYVGLAVLVVGMWAVVPTVGFRCSWHQARSTLKR